MMASPHVSACEQLAEILSGQRSELCIQTLSTLEQLRQLWEIDKAAYAECSLEFDEFAEWWHRYPLGSQCLMDGDRILASLGLYPLSEAQATDFYEGRIPESDLLPVTLAECEDNPQHYWYASGVVVIEGLRGWGSPLKTLLQYALPLWGNSGHVAYPLHIYSVAEYEIGAKILSYLGFSQQRSAAEMPDGCALYAIEVVSPQQELTLLKRKGL